MQVAVHVQINNHATKVYLWKMKGTNAGVKGNTRIFYYQLELHLLRNICLVDHYITSQNPLKGNEKFTK